MIMVLNHTYYHTQELPLLVMADQAKCDGLTARRNVAVESSLQAVTAYGQQGYFGALYHLY